LQRRLFYHSANSAFLAPAKFNLEVQLYRTEACKSQRTGLIS